METALFYLLRVSISAAVLYGCYKLILSKRTFHAINRVTVICTIALTLILPLFTIQLPEMNWQAESDQNAVVETAPEYMPAETSLIYANYAEAPVEASSTEIPWQQILLMVYLAGVGLALVRLLISFTRMSLIIRKSDKKKLSENALLCITHKKVSPFSWLKYIVIGVKDLHDDSHDIIRHEQAHIDYKHSRDLLLFDMYTVLFWFNPFAWLLRRELQIVHEYQADAKVIAQGVDLKNYQLLLIRKCVGEQKFALAHNFEYNNLQKRIRMTMKAKSSSRQKWLYSSIITAAFVAVGLLSWSRLQANGSNLPDTLAANDTTKIITDTVAPITGDGDYSQLKLLKGVLVDLDNMPVEAASLLTEKSGYLYSVQEDGTTKVPTELGRKIQIRLYDGSHYKCEFVVTDSTKISRMKIVLQGHVDKNDWSGVKVFAQTEKEEEATNKAIAEKTKGKPKLTWFQKYWGADSIIAIVDGKVTSKEECLKIQGNEVLYSSSWASKEITNQYDPKYKNKFVSIETKKGIRNGRFYLNDTEISYEELMKINDNPLIIKSLTVIRDKQVMGAYGEKDCIVFVKTNDKRFKHTIKSGPKNEGLSKFARGQKDQKIIIENIEAFAQGFTDETTAVFIDGYPANKERFLRLKQTEIAEMTLSDMFYYKEVAKNLGLKQQSLLRVKTKSGNAGVQGMSVSGSNKKKKYVEVIVSNEGIKQTGLTDQSTAIFIDGKLANKKQFDALKPEQIGGLSLGDVVYQKELAKQYHLKQKTVLQVKLKTNVPYGDSKKASTATWSMKATTKPVSKKLDLASLEEHGFSEEKLPLILLDGKQINLKEYYNLDKDKTDCGSMSAKGDKVIKYYGKKARYGLLKLYTRKGIPVNDKTTAIFIDGKLADKKAYDALNKSEIKEITSTDISCCGHLDEKYNLKQKEIMQVTLKK